MAMCQQDILRAARLQSGMFSSCMNESFGPEGAPTMPFREELVEGVEVTRALNRNFILADGFQLLCRQGDSIPKFLRYQAQVERLYRRAVEEFERVKKLRPELPNEPILDDDQPAEPEENTTASPSPELLQIEPISPGGAGAAMPPPFDPASEPPAPVPAAGPQTDSPSPTLSALSACVPERRFSERGFDFRNADSQRAGGPVVRPRANRRLEGQPGYSGHSVPEGHAHPAVDSGRIPACGFAEGLPVALQVVGPPFSENVLLAIGREFQQRTDWHRRRPPET